MSKISSTRLPANTVSNNSMSKATAPKAPNTAVKPQNFFGSKAVSKNNAIVTKSVKQPATKQVINSAARSKNKIDTAKVGNLSNIKKASQTKSAKLRQPKSNIQKDLSKFDVNSQRYKQLVAKRSEKAVDNYVRRNEGYQYVRNFTHNGIHGIDKIAYNKGARGKITKASAIEIKGSNNPKNKLHPSSFKKQTNIQYVRENLRKAENAGIRDAKQLHELAKKGQMEVKLGTYNIRNDMHKGPKLHTTFTPRKPLN